MTRQYLIVLATILCLSLPAAAQGGGGGGGVFSGKKSQSDRLSVSFEGGTVADYIAALRKADPHANIVEMGDLRAFDMPGVNLKNISMHQALNIIDDRRTETAETYFSLSVDRHGAPNPVYVVQVKSTPRESDNKKQSSVPVEYEIWAVGRILKDQDITQDALLSAVEAVVNLTDNDADAVRINFHPETKLLMAHGPYRAVRAIDDVIDALSVSPELESQKRKTQVLAESLKSAQQTQSSLIRKMQDLQKENQQLMAQLNELRQQLGQQAVEKAQDNGENKP